MAELPETSDSKRRNGSTATEQLADEQAGASFQANVGDTSQDENGRSEEADGQEITIRSRRRRVSVETDAPATETDTAPAQEVPIRSRAAAASGDPILARPEEGQDIEVVLNSLEDQVRGQTATDTQRLALGLLALVRENLERMGGEPGKRAAGLLESLGEDVVSPDFWRGIGSLLRYQVDEQIDAVRRRQRGDYPTDAYGYDPELLRTVEPFAKFLYRSWWRVSVEGVEHIPAEGRALLVANHSGVLPFDGVMIVTAVLEEHPQRRLVRSLFNDWFASVPFLAPLLTGLGQVQANQENATRLLLEDELVCTFPEGYKGISKLFQNRYQLTRFGRGGYVKTALRTGAPLIPVAVVGAEEIYPLLVNAKPIADLLGTPYFPITPFFPLLGPLGMIPLPSKWWISFGAPIETQSYGPQAADDPLLVAELSDQVRNNVQAMINARLALRRSIFFD